MKKKLHHVLVSVLVLAGAAQARTPAEENTAATAAYYDSLFLGTQPRLAELAMFTRQMPKGGDLHHHYSGSIYAEQYMDFVDDNKLCIYKDSLRLETYAEIAKIRFAESDKDPEKGACLSGRRLMENEPVWRELLKRWSTKDFATYGAGQVAPDRQFFQTFNNFSDISKYSYALGFKQLKARAKAENVGYIETMYRTAPNLKDGEFDVQVRAAVAATGAAQLDGALRQQRDKLLKDANFQKSIEAYQAALDTAASGIDDDDFKLRFHAYATRLQTPAEVFSSLVSGFEMAKKRGKLVGVNIVGQESAAVPMRDYTLHMRMIGFLKKIDPAVQVSLHAGELAPGDVPPEGMGFHVAEAVRIAAANRIGHGLDIAYEADAESVMQAMRSAKPPVPVEINLTSNAFINGVEGAAHPVTLYRKYGVPIVISTDDAGVTRHSLSQEYLLFASRYRPSYAELKRIAQDSIEYAFAEPETKHWLRRRLDARFIAFEAQVAAREAKPAYRTAD